MTRIPKTELQCLDHDFSRFRTRIAESRKQDNTYFVSQMNQFQKRYKKAHSENSFAQNIFSFAEQLRNLGIEDLPGIIFSNLAKMPFLKPEAKEIYATKGLEYAQE